MKKKVVVIIIGIFIFVLLASKFLVHSKCKGNEGIPWWPNSGCDCKGVLIPKSEQKNVIGAGASYCIGILREYETN
jgi:hypothetical protein